MRRNFHTLLGCLAVLVSCAAPSQADQKETAPSIPINSGLSDDGSSEGPKAKVCNQSASSRKMALITADSYFKDHFSKYRFDPYVRETVCTEDFCYGYVLAHPKWNGWKYVTYENDDGYILGYARCLKTINPKATCSYTIQVGEGVHEVGAMPAGSDEQIAATMHCIFQSYGKTE